jgi:hypothetical protein
MRRGHKEVNNSPGFMMIKDGVMTVKVIKCVKKSG